MSPLLERDLNSLIAVLNVPLLPLPGKAEVTAGEFLGQVKKLSALLPEGEYALNLCGNRYLFMLAFCAVIVKRQTNLLPPNKNIATQESLISRYSSTYIIHDSGQMGSSDGDSLALVAGVELLDLAELDLSDSLSELQAPCVEDEHLCAITFTSGSTGESTPNHKTWRIFRESSRINAKAMVPDITSSFSLLATVPGQHMWGLETSVLNPMFSNVAVSDTRLLFPKDIQSALEGLPEPRMLVSTPVHLKALVNSGLEFPVVERILCATAPLEATLASRVEDLFKGELCEVYGCSEVGSMAHRRTSRESLWRLFDGFNLSSNTQGTLASASHLPEDIQLNDIMELLEEGRFNLCGRHADMVEIAGKRGSLREINSVLTSIPGVDDGVVFLPESDNRYVARLAAMVVSSNGLDKKKIAEEFRKKLDAAFVPRPIFMLKSLPREENGKLPKRNVQALYESLRK